MRKWPKSNEVLRRNGQWIPGGVVSLNRKSDPNICFARGQGSRVWDVDGYEYIDYQAGFAAVFLGHNDPDVNEAARRTLDDNRLLMGAGPTELEGELAELFCQCVPTVEKIQLTNSGSEATYHALRIARAATERNHVIIMQGGYNGWHNDVAANVMSDLTDIGGRVSPGEYPFDGLSAGIPEEHKAFVHIVNFNDLDSVLYVLKHYPVAAIMLEPILQNIGIVKPLPGYLKALRRLADEYGALLIFDEVKTGFRHALGGYQSLCGVIPDLCTFGKAIANGFPMGIIAGKSVYMDYFIHPEKSKRVLIAGTFNAHPMPTAAAIATLKKLSSTQHNVYQHVQKLGQMLESGLQEIFKKFDLPFLVARESSAFCVYFMDHAPRDYHDIAQHHDFELDRNYRLLLIQQGIFNFPLPVKQGSISFAHSPRDIDETLVKTETVVRNLLKKAAAVPM
ncbi:MAG TPA: aspartate aminotransferase family protein [Candidatus Saccharimonadales bacterium]|nr:aspartate aminotransferase family protein [Candidatus Saccharimonadales bacterium]